MLPGNQEHPHNLPHEACIVGQQSQLGYMHNQTKNHNLERNPDLPSDQLGSSPFLLSFCLGHAFVHQNIRHNVYTQKSM